MIPITRSPHRVGTPRRAPRAGGGPPGPAPGAPPAEPLGAVRLEVVRGAEADRPATADHDARQARTERHRRRPDALALVDLVLEVDDLAGGVVQRDRHRARLEDRADALADELADRL